MMNTPLYSPAKPVRQASDREDQRAHRSAPSHASKRHWRSAAGTPPASAPAQDIVHLIHPASLPCLEPLVRHALEKTVHDRADMTCGLARP